MKKVLLRSIEGGLKEGENWKFIGANRYWVQWLDGNGSLTNIAVEKYLLDPLFWQALGKQQEWEGNLSDKETFYEYKSGNYPKVVILDRWSNEQHRFIDHLIEGGNIDEFFNQLLK